MRIILTLIVFTTLVPATIAQSKNLTSDSDTVFWYKYYRQLDREFGLEETNKVNTNYLFRFWDGGKVIEITRSKNKIEAIVVFFLRQYNEGENERIHFKLSKLSKESSSKIYNLVSKYNLDSMPTDKQITGWQQGNDGLTCIIEYTDNSTYSFKKYWSPESQKDTKEAKLLLDFIDEMNQMEELKETRKKFMEKQPFSKWYKNISGGSVMSKGREPSIRH
jgi:hypothetical protein